MNHNVMYIILGMLGGMAIRMMFGKSIDNLIEDLKVGWWYFKNRPFCIGEKVRLIESYLVDSVVQDITWRYVIIKTDDDSILNIPNRIWHKMTFVNLSRGGKIISKIED